MKLIHVINSLEKESGGPVKSVINLCDSIFNKRIQTILLSKNFENNSLKDNLILPSSKSVKNLLVKANKFSIYDLFINQFFRTIVDEINNPHDIVHIHGIWNLNLHKSILAARKKSSNLIISPRGMLEPWSLKQKYIKKKIALHCYQLRDLNYCHIIHTTSLQEAVNIRNLGIRRPIAVIPNIISLPTYPDQFKRIDKTKRLLFLSRIHPKKGIYELIQAWSLVKTYDWKLSIVGPGESDYVLKLKKIIRNKNLKNIEITDMAEGEMKHMIFKSADLFILPSYSENFGNVIAEALSYGLPVITTKMTPWECIDEFKFGWFIDTGVKPLVRALNEALITSPEKLQEMGKRGKLFFQNQLSLERLSKKYISLYYWISGLEKKPDFII